MKIKNKDLIADLVERTKDCLNKAEKLKQLSVEKLNQKANAESWSALECVEHLNRYGNFYIPEIKKRMQGANSVTEQTLFKSGKLGNYFAEMLAPKEKLNRMKTFKSMNPAGSKLSMDELNDFVHQQHQILEILDQCRKLNLTKTKTSITISKLIKLRLGDTLRVVIYHNQRHLLQAERAVA